MSTVFLLQADSQAAARLAHTIEADPTLKVVHTVSTLAAARLALSAVTFDVVVTDLWLRDAGAPALMDGLAAALRHGRTRVLAIAMSGDDPRLMDALCRGADGYFALSRFASTLPEAVAQVLRGESTMSPQLARQVARRLEAEGLASTGVAAGGQQPLGLDEGERQVLQRIGEGYLPGEVAGALQQSPHAVGRAIRGIYRKLQFLQQAGRFSLAA